MSEDLKKDDLTPTQKLILEKAKEHFLRDGYKSASLRQIVKEAGFTQGAFYGYYKSKEELFSAIVDDTAKGIFSILKDIADEMDQFPAESRMLHMSECYIKRLPELIDFMFDHHAEFVMIMKKSEGTRYADFLNQLQNMSQSNTVRRMNTSKEQLPVSPYALQALLNSYYQSVFGILMADLSKEDTYQAMLDIQKFYQIGFMGML